MLDHITNATMLGKPSIELICRFTQHRAKRRRRKKEGATFDCTCKNGTVVKVNFNTYNSPSTYPNKYRIKSGALLTEDWVVSRNPISAAEKKNLKSGIGTPKLAVRARTLCSFKLN